jgi:hypothetical protein
LERFEAMISAVSWMVVAASVEGAIEGDIVL